MFFLHSICIFILNHIVHKLSWRIMIPPWDGMGQDCGNSEITNCDKIVEPSFFGALNFDTISSNSAGTMATPAMKRSKG